MTAEAKQLSITIGCDWRALYERYWRPEAFPRWAAGMSNADLRQEKGVWHARGPGGDVTIRFTSHNDFGVMDHWVTTAGGELYIPLRIVANGRAAEVLFTLFRPSGMDDNAFAADIETVAGDLRRLKTLAEG